MGALNIGEYIRSSANYLEDMRAKYEGQPTNIYYLKLFFSILVAGVVNIMFMVGSIAALFLFITNSKGLNPHSANYPTQLNEAVLATPLSFLVLILLQIAAFAIFAVVSLTIMNVKYSEYKDVFKVRLPSDHKAYVIAAGVGLLGVILLQIVGVGLVSFGGYELDDFANPSAVAIANIAKQNIWMTVLIVALIVPAYEELFFRGYLLTMLRIKVSSPVIPVLVQGVAFGMMHFVLGNDLGWFVVLWTGMIGCVAGFFTVKYKSVVPSFIVHALYNGASIILASI